MKEDKITKKERIINVGDTKVIMHYEEEGKTFQECMLNILKIKDANDI